MRPWIDYTNKDYESLLEAMKALARKRLEAWTDHSPNDLGILLMELFAAMGDSILYFQDRIANESFLETAVEERSLIHLLRLIGYELQPATPASAELTLLFEDETAPVTIPPGTQFGTKKTASQESVTFEYVGSQPVTFDLTDLDPVSEDDPRKIYRSLPVQHSESIEDEELGKSTGNPNLSFLLARSPLIVESLRIEVEEGNGWTVWERRENLLFHVDDSGKVHLSSGDKKHYYVQIEEGNATRVIFGDGQFGAIPPDEARVRASYRVGGGEIGNVAARSITEFYSDIDPLEEVFNPLPATGGSDREDLEHARRFAPLLYRAGNRAVTLDDFASLAHSVGGVAKVHAESFGWNTVYLYVAPEADPTVPADPKLRPSDSLRRQLIGFFRDKKMIGTDVRIRAPIIIPIEVRLRATTMSSHYRMEVEQEIRAAIEGLLAYGEVDFARPVYLSKIYEAIEALPGIHNVHVEVFRRELRSAEVGAPGPLLEIPGYGTPYFLRPEVSPPTLIESGGRIEIRAAEIPTLGSLAMLVEGGIGEDG